MSLYIKGSDGGGCRTCDNNPCGACNGPVLKCDSISASLTKCGFAEFVSPSTPPKIYRTKSQSGSVSYCVEGGGDPSCTCSTDTWSGNATYARGTCALTDTRQLTVTTTHSSTPGCGGADSCSITVSANADDSDRNPPDPNACAALSLGSCGSPAIGPDFGCCSAPTTETQTTRSYVTSCAGQATVNVSVTLSNEYTTADLITDTVAKLPSYPGTFTGYCSSYRNLTTDELTYSIRRFKYKFLIPAGAPAGYVIKWMEGSTAKCYAWDGVATETPVYGPVNEPGTNGTVSITGVTAYCDGTTCP